ncbi:hypothetical protein TYRP_003831 [Tyrophagus putrescentiae]|nr:hypothetical protein TYRP_003831 [Tyrophagus putrescentiae]
MSAFREELDPRYQMYVSTSEESTGQHYFIGDLPLQPSSAKLAEQINALQQKVPLLLWSTFAPLYTVLMTFYYTNILLHGVYTVSAFSLLFWAILLPAWTLYLCIALFGSMLYIVLSSRVLRLRQESLLKRKYRRFVGANGRLLAICRHIEENSQFSNPVLSTLLPQFMIVPPFYSVVQQGLLDKIVCFTCVLECNAGLYCLVNECSALDWLNGQMETTLRQFNFEFCFKKRFKDQKLIKLPLLMLLKAESLQSADRLKPYTYCAFGSFRIVARSYFSAAEFDLSILHFNTLLTNPFVFTHQMVPRSLWSTFDVAIICTVLVSVGILLVSVFKEKLDPRYQMYVSTSEENTGGQHYFIGDLPLQPTSAKLSQQINALQQKVPLLLWSNFVPLFTVLVTFYHINVLLNGLYTPAWTFYMSIAIFGSMLYIVLNSRVLKLRQEGVLRRLQGLLKNKKCSVKRFTKKYRRLLSANSRLLAICRHIEESSRLSNPVFSILLPHFMIVPPFMLTVFLATSTNFFPSSFSSSFGDKNVQQQQQQGLLDTVFCLSCVLQCNAALYFVVNECSALDGLNGQIESTLRQFNFEFCFRKAV